ncbi:MAG: hypothetical protein HC794_10830 [Nitrospiraceae bacterium]|nr:hypothetical protein [Nitrospiraceae bacterium]
MTRNMASRFLAEAGWFLKSRRHQTSALEAGQVISTVFFVDENHLAVGRDLRIGAYVDPHGPPGRGDAVIFSWDGEDGHRRLYQVLRGGGSPRRVTDSLGKDGAPTWSHDGHHIAFFVCSTTNARCSCATSWPESSAR